MALDANVPNAYHPDVRAGVEWMYRGMVAFRTGYRKELGSQDDPLSGAIVRAGGGAQRDVDGLWLRAERERGGRAPRGAALRARAAGGRGVPAVEREHFGSASSHDFESAKDNTLIGPPVPRSKKR